MSYDKVDAFDIPKSDEDGKYDITEFMETISTTNSVKYAFKVEEITSNYNTLMAT